MCSWGTLSPRIFRLGGEGMMGAEIPGILSLGILVRPTLKAPIFGRSWLGWNAPRRHSDDFGVFSMSETQVLTWNELGGHCWSQSIQYWSSHLLICEYAGSVERGPIVKSFHYRCRGKVLQISWTISGAKHDVGKEFVQPILQLVSIFGVPKEIRTDCGSIA